MTVVADLLYPEPAESLERGALAQALTFAFATGGTGDDFDRILNRARLGPSSFRPECFARDLFLSDFVSRCVKLRIEDREYELRRGQLMRELSHPPCEPETITFRQGVTREVSETPTLRRAFEHTWLAIHTLIHLLESADRGKRYDAIGRRFEILRAAKHAIDSLGAAEFASARSGLSRLHELARTLKQSEGYADLSALLDHEGNLAVVDLRVRVGQDGQVRGFDVLRAAENHANPFHVSRWGRFVARVSTLFGGYRLRQAEILGRLANHVFDGVLEGVIALFQVALQSEFYLAALAFGDRAHAAGLAVCLPEFAARRGAPGTSQLEGLYNPLLLLEPRAPRPCDLCIDERAFVIITGPNSGGKTRLLQAVGFVQLLGQAGFYVPAKRARLVLRDGLFVSLIQESSADQPEGRLGMELLRIRRLFEELGFNCLVVLDELCSGTNPSEGEEIFQLVVTLLAELEPQAFITTHFLKFAARLALEQPLAGLEFLQVELDARNDPTYGFVPGVAPTSLAGRTAERLGVTREALEALVEARKRERPSTAPGATRATAEAGSRTL